jgi:hypothetical protein
MPAGPTSVRFEDVAALTAMVGAIFSGAWVVGKVLVDRSRQRVDLCMQLYQQYFSDDMANARRRGWFVVTQMAMKRPCRMSDYWADPEIAPRYVDVNRVMAFFYALQTLDAMGRIDRRLARRFFGYQYAHWSRHLEPLVDDTLKHDRDHPEVLEAFSGGGMAWLKDDAHIAIAQAPDQRPVVAEDRAAPAD